MTGHLGSKIIANSSWWFLVACITWSDGFFFSS